MSVRSPAPLPSFTQAPALTPAKPKASAPHGHAKALKHHKAVGNALAAHDHKGAMSQTGHMMLAIRSAMKASPAPMAAPDASMTSPMAASEGTDEPQAAPMAKKPSFNRAAFGAMKPKAAQ